MRRVTRSARLRWAAPANLMASGLALLPGTTLHVLHRQVLAAALRPLRARQAGLMLLPARRHSYGGNSATRVAVTVWMAHNARHTARRLSKRAHGRVTDPTPRQQVQPHMPVRHAGCVARRPSARFLRAREKATLVLVPLPAT